MNPRRMTLLIYALCLLGAAGTVASGCAGKHARERVLAPALAPLVTEAVAHARSAALPRDDEGITLFETAMHEARYYDALAVWPAVQADALRAIDARASSSGIKVSLRENVARLDSGLRKQVARGSQ